MPAEPGPVSRRVHDGCALRASLPADALAVRQTLTRLTRTPCLADIPATARECTELALAEVLNNVVRHGYRGAAGRISVWLCVAGTCVVCRVRDRGVALPQQLLRDSPQPSRDAVHGYGWILIRSLAQDVVYRRSGDDNLLQFRIPFAQ